MFNFTVEYTLEKINTVMTDFILQLVTSEKLWNIKSG